MVVGATQPKPQLGIAMAGERRLPQIHTVFLGAAASGDWLVWGHKGLATVPQLETALQAVPAPELPLGLASVVVTEQFNISLCPAGA